MVLLLAASVPTRQAALPRAELQQAPRRCLGSLPQQRRVARRPQSSKQTQGDTSKEPPHEGSVPAPAHEPAEDDEAPSDEEVAAILATDPTDRAPGQEEPHSEDEADPAEFHAVLHEERQAALEGAEKTASAEGEEGADRDTGAQGA